MDVLEKVNLAQAVCEEKVDNRFYRIYPFTTENIRGYLPYFDLENKSLFTVGSSADQAINAILEGAVRITLFDICPFIREYYELKKAAIKTLTREEYLSFFSSKNGLFGNRETFDINAYNKIRELLNDETNYFWSELFKRYKSIMVRKKLFMKDEEPRKIVTMTNNYLRSDFEYLALRELIDKVMVKCIVGDIFEVESTGEGYDNIFLSNIATKYGLEKSLELFYRMLNFLNDDGKIMISYLYDLDLPYEESPNKDSIYNITRAFMKFPQEVSCEYFTSLHGIRYRDPRMIDGILTYKKVKKIVK